jgi:putative phage-type endonuclease
MIPQGTPEWAAARLGRVTASRIADVVARTKTGWGAMRFNYMADLIAERLIGVATEGFKSHAMQHGTEMEPQARAEYEFFRDVEVAEGGFVLHPRIEMAGASPDGLVGDDGLVEIKCPLTKTHIDALLGAGIPGDYVKQMQWQMACTGRAWCDFVSFDPRMPEDLRLFIRRVPRDDKAIGELETEVVAFLAEVDGKLAELQRLRLGEPSRLKADLKASLVLA